MCVCVCVCVCVRACKTNSIFGIQSRCNADFGECIFIICFFAKQDEFTAVQRGDGSWDARLGGVAGGWRGGGTQRGDYGAWGMHHNVAAGGGGGGGGGCRWGRQGGVGMEGGWEWKEEELQEVERRALESLRQET